MLCLKSSFRFQQRSRTRALYFKKWRDQHSILSEEAPPWLAPTSRKNLKNTPSRMAKNLLFLCTLPEYLSIFNNYGVRTLIQCLSLSYKSAPPISRTQLSTRGTAESRRILFSRGRFRFTQRMTVKN